MLRSSVRPVALLLLIVTVFLGGTARALPPDPAARGLDVYLHVASSAAPGGILELSAKAYGFPTVTHAVPLANAVIEVGWDPELLDGLAPPPSVQATTDSEGRAKLAVEVPSGSPRDLGLLVAVRHGAHTRTQAVPVKRGATASVEIHTADTRVVPTSTIAAWVRVVGTAGEPLAGAGVVVSLLEGGVARHTETYRTDRGGLVMARVPIPRIDEPVWQWTLQATADAPGVAATSVVLTPREESPGTPTLEAEWQEPKGGVRPGGKVPFKIRIRDATGQPVTEHAIAWWIGVKGTTPPKTDKEWEKLAARGVTDGAGELTGVREAPTLVKTKGTALVLVTKTELEGHPLERVTEVGIGAANASATLAGEAPAIVPGLSQRFQLSVFSRPGEGVVGKFVVTGDGLAATVTTDVHGEAELTWSAPLGIGANREVGPCAGGVAAAVTVRKASDIEALRAQQEPFVLCLPVDRDAAGLVHVTPEVAKPGEKVHVVITRARGRGEVPGSYSVVLAAREHEQAIAGWLEPKPDGTAAGDLLVPANAAPGSWDVSVALPEGTQAARLLAARVLVVPTTLPQLIAKRSGGRATPGGVVEFEAQLTDGHGKPLPGAVSAIVVDAFGGGDANVTALDTRTRLCRALGIALDRCDAALERDPATETTRRVLLGGSADKTSVTPVNDPGAHASRDLEASFGAVLHSLEGAIFESAKSPQSLMDSRRREHGRWVFNPELFTLVTDAMDDPPLTPGGEKLALGDLVAVDPQVTFDNVARRVTRLKLFTVLQAVRNFRKNGSLDPDEPVFKDPNALIRRLVRDGALSDDQLLDPWGGTIQYIASRGAPPAPFLGSIRGFELHAPGPDGRVGTGDDVRDPFERVVRSGSPYAKAMQEDRIVDAKWDMVVAEETVSAWERLFEELTGRQLGASGRSEGIGLSGTHSGGGGVSVRMGSASGFGHGRGSSGISTGDAFWSPPLRTDAEGRVRLSIPLGGAETTWRVAFVAVPDGLGPASTTADVVSDLPLSLRAFAGARWVAGDVVDTELLVRNRTGAPVRATIEAVAEGAAALEGPPAARVIDVPAKGARTVRVRVRAKQPGEGRLVLIARAPGLPDDVLRHSWEIVPAGEKRALTQTAWVDGRRELGLALDHGYRLMGEPRLVLERGFDDAAAGSLESLEPERQISPRGLADAIETALRIQRWATTKDTPRHRALARIAEDTGARALGRFNALMAIAKAAPGGSPDALLQMRVTQLTKRPSEKPEAESGVVCPPEWSAVKTSGRALRADEDEVLDLEPPDGPEAPPCWGAYVASATRSLAQEGDAEVIARALLALADRPRHVAITTSLAARLRKLVKLDEDGEIDGPALLASRPARQAPPMSANNLDRSRRAVVYAALLRTQRLGLSPASASALFGKIARLRDVTGGYGSSLATLAVVRALLTSQLDAQGASHVRVRARGVDRVIDVPASGFVTVPLPAGTLDVDVAVDGQGVVARLERPVLRSWTRPPPLQESPVGLEVVWPEKARAGSTGMLVVTLRHGFTTGVVTVDVQIPLPPGITLAATTSGASQVQGVLALRQQVSPDGLTTAIPLRFGLSGKVTVPEATARIARSASGVATAPARVLSVR